MCHDHNNTKEYIYLVVAGLRIHGAEGSFLFRSSLQVVIDSYHLTVHKPHANPQGLRGYV